MMTPGRQEVRQLLRPPLPDVHSLLRDGLVGSLTAISSGLLDRTFKIDSTPELHDPVQGIRREASG